MVVMNGAKEARVMSDTQLVVEHAGNHAILLFRQGDNIHDVVLRGTLSFGLSRFEFDAMVRKATNALLEQRVLPYGVEHAHYGEDVISIFFFSPTISQEARNFPISIPFPCHCYYSF